MTENAAVVLPQPDSPTSPYDSPFWIVSVSPRRTAPVDAADAVDDLELLEVEGGVAHRSKVCAIASAIRLMPTIRVAMAMAGKSTAHQTPALMNW